jgi:hypothetical protein
LHTSQHCVSEWLSRLQNGILSDIIHRLYHGMHSCQIVTWSLNDNFIDTHKKVWPSLHQILHNSSVPKCLYTEFHTDWTICMESTDINLFPPLSKIWLSLHRFSPTYNQWINLCGHLYKIYRFYLCHYVKYGFYCPRFHKTYICWVAWYGDLLYQLLSIVVTTIKYG